MIAEPASGPPRYADAPSTLLLWNLAALISFRYDFEFELLCTPTLT